MVALCVQLEAEAAQLDDAERPELLAALGLGSGALDRFLARAYHLLGLRTFLTTGPKESRAWTFRSGASAVECAGAVHSDIQRGFIRADTISWDRLLAAGSWVSARDQGWVRSEGKGYRVADGGRTGLQVQRLRGRTERRDAPLAGALACLMPVDSDHRLLAELEPSVERLYERHLRQAKEWHPHKLVPWSRGRDYPDDYEWSPEEAGLSAEARSALFVNVLTEDNLPYYFRDIERMFGRDGAWGHWARRWTAEEGRHGQVIHDYLAVTRSVDPVSLERARMAQVESGRVPEPPNALEGLAYVALQELATRISHYNTGRHIDDPGRHGDHAPGRPTTRTSTSSSTATRCAPRSRSSRPGRLWPSRTR